MKFNESQEDKKSRLKRCLVALKNAGIGQPSAFVGMKIGQSIDIQWNREADTDVLDADDEEIMNTRVEKQGSGQIDDDSF